MAYRPVPTPGSPNNPRKALVWVSQLQRVLIGSTGTPPRVASQRLLPRELLAQGGAWAEAVVITGGQGSANLNYRFPNLNRMLSPDDKGMFEAASVNLRLLSSRRAVGVLSSQVLTRAHHDYAEGEPATLEFNGRLALDAGFNQLARVWRLELEAFGSYTRSSTGKGQIEARMLLIQADLPVTIHQLETNP